MNAIKKFAAFLEQVDLACARMNAGLSACATVLAVLVAFMGILRASELASDLSEQVAAPYATSINQAAVDAW
jgi:hypothetical protein